MRIEQEILMYVEKPVTAISRVSYKDSEGQRVNKMVPGGTKEDFVQNILLGLTLSESNMVEGDYRMFQLPILTKPVEGALVINDIYEKLYAFLPQFTAGTMIVKALVTLVPFGYATDPANSLFKPYILDVRAVEATPEQAAYIQGYKNQFENESHNDEDLFE